MQTYQPCPPDTTLPRWDERAGTTILETVNAANPFHDSLRTHAYPIRHFGSQSILNVAPRGDVSCRAIFVLHALLAHTDAFGFNMTRPVM